MFNRARTRDNVGDYFRERATTYDDGNWVKDSALLASHVDMAGPTNASLVLDAGCGTGILGACFADKSMAVFGVDKCEEMLLKAKQRLTECILSDICQVPFADESFDVILCRQVLQYVSLSNVLREFKRILKHRGKLVISSIVPYGADDLEWFTMRTRIKKPMQLWIPTEPKLIDQLVNVGFRLEAKANLQTVSLFSKTAFRTKIERNAAQKLRDHYLGADSTIRTLYAVNRVGEDIKYRNNWFIGTFVRS